MKKPPYAEWEHIMLDTSIIFSYIQASRGSNTDLKCVFVKRLIDDLNSKKNTKNKKRNFYVSAITISEMYDKSIDVKKTEQIISKMNVSEMTYVPFDTDIAEYMTSNYHSVLGTKKLNTIAKELSWSENNLVLAREWISKDLMILATADYLKCDTVITLDVNTFLPMANKLDFFCCHAIKENFNANDKYIFEYY